jgi:hypothetical protein
LVEKLSALGIGDAEQVVAVAAIPDARSELQQVLDLKDKAFQDFLDAVQGMLPEGRAAALSTPSPKDMGLGVRPPTPEMRAAADRLSVAFEREAAEAVELAGSVNLIPYFPPIRNQGPRGTCVSFALTALNEYINRRRGVVRDLSEQHLYYEIKLIDGSPSGCGTWQLKAVNALRTRGECREVVWPYLSATPCNNHGPVPPGARPDGLACRLDTLAVPANNVLAYRTHMAKQRAVTLSIPVYNSWYQSPAVRQTGRITMRIGNEQRVGGHAVCLVGYVDTPTSPGGGYFIVRNSWGTSNFGATSPFGAGYGTIPYQYIANDADEAFTAVVPGITGTDDVVAEDKLNEGSNVTIEVGSNVKITIQTS